MRQREEGREKEEGEKDRGREGEYKTLSLKLNSVSKLVFPVNNFFCIFFLHLPLIRTPPCSPKDWLGQNRGEGCRNTRERESRREMEEGEDVC
jgi:hypothetical protein